MSKKAKFTFLLAFLSLVVAVATQFVIGAWLPINTVLLAVAGGLVALSIVLDWRLYWEFLTMRTTKHGMNMGLLILLVVVSLVCLNYLANQHNKTWDLTSEKLNSLSDQSAKLLENLSDDLNVKVFYNGPSGQEEKQKVQQGLRLYQDKSSYLKVQYINAYVDQQQAIRYLGDRIERDSGPVSVFVEHAGKKVEVDPPFDEATLTSAMIKATRNNQAKIYFVKGHGEKEIEDNGDTGLKEFAKMLGDASYSIDSFTFLEGKGVPTDATLVAIVGPTVAYLDSELDFLRAYLRKGGHLFVALDPGQRHNLANLTRSMGVQFANNYVLTQTQIVGGGPMTVLGREFDKNSEVTKSLPQASSFAVFPIVSEVMPATEKTEGFNVREIVKTDGYSFTINDISKPIRGRPETKAISIGLEVKGKVAAVEPKKGEEKVEPENFEAIIFGDSDFLANRVLQVGVNRDLAMNAIASLANQADLISIRPKMPKGTMVTLTYYARLAVIVAGLAVPILLMILSAVLWFRRRGA